MLVKARTNLLLYIALLLKRCMSLNKLLSLYEVHFPLLQKEDALGELFAGVQCHYLSRMFDTVAWFTSCPFKEAGLCDTERTRAVSPVPPCLSLTLQLMEGWTEPRLSVWGTRYKEALVFRLFEADPKLPVPGRVTRGSLAAKALYIQCDTRRNGA